MGITEMIKKTQKGFTLIELMIVVAIIGILAAVAIPAYQDYIARAQVSEAMTLLGGAKTPMSEFYADNGRWPAALRSVVPNTLGTYVGTMYIQTGAGAATQSATIRAQFRSTGVNADISSGTLDMLTTDGGNRWTCTNPSFDNNLVPSACR